jgi:spermidine/putrescine transport system ATP-binding protein
MTETGGTLVELCRVSKSYGEALVLSGIDLAIRDGELITLLGPSGSGKTTVLRLIGGFTAPSAGRIELDGRDITQVPINRRPFNTVFQDYALFPHLTVARNVGYGLMVRGVPKRQIRERVGRTLELVALERFGDRYPGQLSGGQRQRVALARAIICEPRLILLDEPLSALDAELRRQMQVFLKRLQKEIRTTFLFVTHDQEEAIAIADRICVMNQGAIVQLGTPHEIYYRPVNEYVARFFGDNNLIEGIVAEAAGGRQRFSTRLGDFWCAIDGPALAEGSRGRLVVRPEALRLGGDAATPPADNRLAVRIEDTQFAGATSRIEVQPLADAKAASLAVKQPSRAGGLALAPGEITEIGWSAGECRLVPC